MNPWMLSDLADSRELEIRREAARRLRVREIRREAARRRSQAPPRESQPMRGVSGGRGRLRRRVGFGLVEAGLHVLATTRSTP
jgi:hypothetical protein